MITIPLYIFLFLYFIFLAVFVTFMLINLYHLVVTASFTLPSFLMTFFIFASVALVCFFTLELVTAADIDWRTGLTVFNIDWFRALFGAQPF